MWSPELGITSASKASGVACRGLSTDEAEQRQSEGHANTVELASSRPLAAVVRANVLTRFNAIVLSLATLVLVFGDAIDAAFGLVSIINSGIGIVQEVRAKRSLDALTVLLVPRVAVVRDGRERSIAPSDVVLGDLVRLRSGDQVPVDGSVGIADGLELDESSLTGESEPQPKGPGDEVLSGSAVVGGTGLVTATRVGRDAWAHRLTDEARRFELTRSELRAGIDRILLVTGWLLPPLGALLFWSQTHSDVEISEGIVAAVAGVIALVPQGLVLLVSMAMAVAVVRLAKQRVIAQELAAVEGLARIDVLCVDKTGTLTTGRLTVDRIDAVDDRAEELRTGLAALAGLEAARSTTLDALRTHLDDVDTASWEPDAVVAFSAAHKWSGATFVDRGSWVLGAPEVLLAEMGRSQHQTIAAQVERLTDAALRVLLVGHSTASLVGARLPADLRPVGIIALAEEVRPGAAETLAYFRAQGVAIKVISGDNPRTVAAVAENLGLVGAERYVDLRSVDVVEAIPAETAVFGRVRPEQKRELVRRFQAAGHIVAMTGDGVNDIPSLKAADIGIAMDTATPATKAVAQLVLLDGRFEHLPVVVAEGRRVIANMERVSSLFVTKTIYATILALVFGLSGSAFPFLPRHLTIVATITIGAPAFLMSFRAVDEPCRPGYLRRVLRFAAPAGLTAAGATIATFALMRSPLVGVELAEARTAATVSLTIVGLWILYRLARPFGRWERLLILASVASFAFTIAWPPSAELYALRLPGTAATAWLFAAVGGAIAALEVALRVVGSRWPELSP